MKKLVLGMAIIAALSVLAPAAEATPVLIGGFNGTLGAWTINDGGDLSVETSLASGALTLEPTEGSHFLSVGYDGVYVNPGLIHAGDWLSFDYVGFDSVAANWGITIPDRPFTSVNGVLTATNGQWKTVSVDLSSLADISTANLWFYGASFALDSVTLGAPAPVVPEPATLSLLGLGLVGVARTVRRRKRKGDRR